MPSETKQTWLVDGQGNYARVDGSAVATWTPHGWKEAPEGPKTAFVWMQHEITGGLAKFPQAVASRWESLGWHPSAPPEPVDLTKDPELVDVQAQPASPAPKKATTQSANGGNTKEQ